MLTEEFIDYIDKIVPDEVWQSLCKELGPNSNMIDLINIQERSRAYVIKQQISSTHMWTKATVINNDGSLEECFWCDKCSMKCSAFDHISCLSIISKVKDNKPTYTIHNQYLMFTCNEVLNMNNSNKSNYCFHCGIPEQAKTDKCEIINC